MVENKDKSVFISYRRKYSFHARSVYENLKANGYECFLDSSSLASGDFEKIIFSEIKSRAYFLVILTPDALERVEEPDDWLRREIEIAIDSERIIIPLLFDSFEWKKAELHLIGKLSQLKRYNSLRVPPDLFDEAMDTLRNKYLNTKQDNILYPTLITELMDSNNSVGQSKQQLTEKEYFERGKSHYYMSNHDFAIDDFTEAIKLNSKNPILYFYRGMTYNSKMSISKAIDDFNYAIYLDPQYLDAYIQRGLAFYGNGDYDKAISTFSQAIIIDKSGDGIYFRGLVNISKNDYKQAIKDFTEALIINPLDSLSYVKRGIAYSRAGNIEKGFNDFNKAILMDSKNSESYRERGLLHEISGNIASAIDDYKQALEIDPEDFFAEDYLKNIIAKINATNIE